MVFKVYKDDKFAVIVNEDATTNWEIVINARCVEKRSPTDVYADRTKPFAFRVLKTINLSVLTVEFAKYFRYAPLDLHLCFFGHQRCKRHGSEIPSHRKPHFLQFAKFSPHHIYFLFQCIKGYIFKLVAVSEIKTRVQL